jgi:hypothetical protein
VKCFSQLQKIKENTHCQEHNYVFIVGFVAALLLLILPPFHSLVAVDSLAGSSER